jgi:hypothetical protein
METGGEEVIPNQIDLQDAAPATEPAAEAETTTEPVAE